MSMTVIWSVALIVFLIAEGATAGLASIWFALGAAVALITTLLGGPVWLQILLFAIVSVVTLVLTRPLARKYINSRTTPTNADRLIGMEGIVTERIDNIAATGSVSIDGKLWMARAAEDSQTFDEGEHVIINEIRGVRLLVTPAAATAIIE